MEPRVLRLFVPLCFALLAGSLLAQPKFTVNGRLKIEGGDLDGARAVVYKNGEKERTISSGLSKFSLDLDLNNSYIISFEKDGYVSKKLSFNTKLPSGVPEMEFTPFTYAVSLFKQYDDLNLVVFNQPVGVIRYEPGTSDFDYDTDYTRSIQSQLQEAMEQVEKKEKDEANAKSANAAREAQLEKERRKAEEEARKQAAADAKAEAEQRRKAEAQLKEQQRREAQAQQQAEAPPVAQAAPTQVVQEVAPPPPAPPPPIEKKPAPPTAKAGERSGEEPRRTIVPVVAEERSTVRRAVAVEGSEVPPVVEPVSMEAVRHEELFEEPNKVTMVVKLESDGATTEYRKVVYKWGGAYYFKNGYSCSRELYDREARGEQLAGATPRSKGGF